MKLFVNVSSKILQTKYVIIMKESWMSIKRMIECVCIWYHRLILKIKMSFLLLHIQLQHQLCRISTRVVFYTNPKNSF